ncbi:MAG TPA: hypothetical protein VMC85_12215 [Desulfomonilaceae bacterium]|nr:hypothetical protein [Desulfomonilaceae bacterium]
MLRAKAAMLLCLAAFLLVATAQAFDYASYKPGDLDEILAMPRPKSGVDVIPFQKFALKVTLESCAERCPVADVLKLSMTMLPDMYPKGFVNTLSQSKCIKVKSLKGITVAVAIQDRVADFLPKEVPLGTEIQIYCLLICMTADSPGILVNDFQAPETNPAGPDEQRPKGAARGDDLNRPVILALDNSKERPKSQ